MCMKRAFGHFIAACWVACLAGCGGQPENGRISGMVNDNWGKPLPSARISIANSSFSATSDGDGLFSIEYVPGALSLLITADGHTSRTVDLNLQQASSYPLDPTVLYLVPESRGFFYVGDDGYYPLVQVSVAKSESSRGFMENVIRYSIAASGGSEFTQEVDLLGDKFMSVEGDVQVINNGMSGYKLYSLSQNRFGTLTVGGGGQESDLVMVGERIEEIAEGLSVSLVDLQPETLTELINGGFICYARTSANFAGQSLIVDSERASCLPGVGSSNNLVSEEILSVREKVREFVGASATARNIVAEFAIVNARIPRANEVRVPSENIGYVRSVAWDGTYIMVTGDEQALGVSSGVSVGWKAELTESGGVRFSCTALEGAQYVAFCE